MLALFVNLSDLFLTHMHLFQHLMILFLSLVHLGIYVRFSNQESLQKQAKLSLIEYSTRVHHTIYLKIYCPC